MNIKNYNKGKYKKEIDKLVNKLNEEKEKYNNLFIESCRKMIEVNPNNIESYKEKINFLKQKLLKNKLLKRLKLQQKKQ